MTGRIRYRETDSDGESLTLAEGWKIRRAEVASIHWSLSPMTANPLPPSPAAIPLGAASQPKGSHARLRLVDLDPELPAEVALRRGSSIVGACRTPCTIEIDPGPAELMIKAGRTRFEADLLVPFGGATARIQHAACDNECAALGIVGIAVGGLAMMSGLLYANDKFLSSGSSDSRGVAPGWLLAGAGLAIGIIGAVLLSRASGNRVTTSPLD